MTTAIQRTKLSSLPLKKNFYSNLTRLCFFVAIIIWRDNGALWSFIAVDGGQVIAVVNDGVTGLDNWLSGGEAGGEIEERFFF